MACNIRYKIFQKWINKQNEWKSKMFKGYKSCFPFSLHTSPRKTLVSLCSSPHLFRVKQLKLHTTTSPHNGVCMCWILKQSHQKLPELERTTSRKGSDLPEGSYFRFGFTWEGRHNSSIILTNNCLCYKVATTVTAVMHSKKWDRCQGAWKSRTARAQGHKRECGVRGKQEGNNKLMPYNIRRGMGGKKGELWLSGYIEVEVKMRGAMRCWWAEGLQSWKEDETKL